MRLTILFCLVLVAVAMANDAKLQSKKEAAKQHHFSVIKEEGDMPGYYGYDGYVPPATPPPPEGWTCVDSYYATLDGCDCNCGVFDPDCNVDGQFVFGCFPEANQVATCIEPSTCVFEEADVPVQWTCNPAFYDTNDGCDCNCGILDPDCLVSEQFIFGCNAGINPTCVSPGVCQYEEEIPAGWLCSASFYGTADGCDCNCGIPDPDCSLPEDEGGLLLNCPCEGMVCAESGFCSGICGDFFISAAPVADLTTAPAQQCTPVIVYRDDDGEDTISVIEVSLGDSSPTTSCDCEAFFAETQSDDTSSSSALAASALLTAAGVIVAL